MVSIIIPAYNEEEAIGEVIEDILEAMQDVGYEWELIVVNDGSRDRTREIVEGYGRRGVRLVNHPYSMGGGTARTTGIHHAQGEIVVVTDGDGTYPVRDIPRLVEEMDGYDMVVGARVKEAGTLKALRIPAKFLIRKLAEFMTGSPIPDLNSGLRAMRKETFLEFETMLPPGHSWVSTITLCMLANSHPVKYVPIDYYPRKGKSTFHPVKDTANYLMLIFRTVTWFNPLRFFLPLALLLFLGGLGKAIADIVNYHWHIATSTVVLLLASLQVFTVGMLADLISRKGSR